MSFFRGGGTGGQSPASQQGYSRLPPGAGGGLPGGPRSGRDSAPQQAAGLGGLVDRWAPSYGGDAPPQYMGGGRGAGPR